jgi:hypothetical protein
MMNRNTERVLQHQIGLAEALFDVSFTPRELVKHVGNVFDQDILRRAVVGRSVVVHDRRAGFHRLQNVEDRRQLLVFDFDEIDCLFSRLTCLGRHRCDSVTDVAHLVPAQHRDIADALALKMIRLVFAGDDRFDARHLPSLGSIDAQDARMRVWASKNFAPQRVGKVHIGGINSLATGLLDALHFCDRSTDD